MVLIGDTDRGAAASLPTATTTAQNAVTRLFWLNLAVFTAFFVALEVLR